MVVPLLPIQRQQCIKFRVLRAQDFYAPLAQNCAKRQHLPAPKMYKNQSPITSPSTMDLVCTPLLLLVTVLESCQGSYFQRKCSCRYVEIVIWCNLHHVRARISSPTSSDPHTLQVLLDFACFVLSLGAKKSTQTFFVQSFSKALRVMDVRTKNRGRPHQKAHFSAAPVMGRNFLTQGRPGVRVRNVRGKSGPKSLCLCCFFFPEWIFRGFYTPSLCLSIIERRLHYMKGLRRD